MGRRRRLRFRLRFRCLDRYLVRKRLIDLNVRSPAASGHGRPVPSQDSRLTTNTGSVRCSHKDSRYNLARPNSTESTYMQPAPS